MLRKIMKYSDLDERKLMDIYTESNFENTEYFYPDETDKNKAVKLVEAGFCNYLKNDFYNLDDSIYWIYEEDGKWLCALRTNMIKPGLFYLEALETPPDSRRKGYACRLINDVLEDMKNDGSFKLCVCISKKNIASLKTHEISLHVRELSLENETILERFFLLFATMDKELICVSDEALYRIFKINLPINIPIDII